MLLRVSQRHDGVHVPTHCVSVGPVCGCSCQHYATRCDSQAAATAAMAQHRMASTHRPHLTSCAPAQLENCELKRTLLKAATEQMLVEQDLVDAHAIISSFQNAKVDAEVQTKAVDTASCAVQATNAFEAPPRPTVSRVLRRSQRLDITGVAHELVPEGVGVESVDTHVLRAGLLKPSVRPR